MAKISFRGKVEKMFNVDMSLAFEYIRVPQLTRKHCDMNAFRRHDKWGGLANSDLFPNVLARIRSDIGERIKLDSIPANVTIDTSGFLAIVSIEV